MVDALVIAAPYIKYKGDDGKYYDLANIYKNMGAYMQLKDSVIDKV